jgi:hypothetical protein
VHGRHTTSTRRRYPNQIKVQPAAAIDTLPALLDKNVAVEDITPGWRQSDDVDPLTFPPDSRRANQTSPRHNHFSRETNDATQIDLSEIHGGRRPDDL